ncbi:Gag-Pol polyprotein [Labeo rohita]|uniref:Gag-Pol polyprotein n=1 Tax=Labeo rohita TaxID=84645 RepID=A0ABQ8L8C1_LABRO|nr:Gag-Pol polyprotein [Labeo rohita]
MLRVCCKNRKQYDDARGVGKLVVKVEALVPREFQQGVEGVEYGVFADVLVGAKKAVNRSDIIRDKNGVIIEELLDTYELVVLNDGRPTRYQIVRNTSSHIDLSIASSNLTRVGEWDVLDSYTMGSHHYPILCRFGRDLRSEDKFQIQKMLVLVEEWGNTSGFKILASKSKYMILGLKRKLPDIGLYMYGSPLEKDWTRKVFGRAAFGVYVETLVLKIGRHISNGSSVLTTELMAILWAFWWIEEARPKEVLICSDSAAALETIRAEKSKVRPGIVNDILIGFACNISFCWVPGHAGVIGNEPADYIAKESLGREIDSHVSLGRVELRERVKEGLIKEWQKGWEKEIKGRHYFSIQPRVKKKCFCTWGGQ